MFWKKQKKSYDKEHLTPVIHSSICNGERVAGFKDVRTGAFTEVMLIRSEKDLETFKRDYGLENVKTEY